MPDGEAEVFPGLSWLGKQPQGWERACGWEEAVMVLGFNVGGRHGEALEQPWLGGGGAP